MKLSLAQIKTVVGDISHNLSMVKSHIATSHRHSDLLIFPELVLTGYIPKDLLLHHWFLEQIVTAQDVLKSFSRQYPSLAFLIGTPLPHKKQFGKGLYNSARLFYQGDCIFEQHKKILPNYDVFEESRYFDSGETHKVFPFQKERLGITICEDIWTKPLKEKQYPCYSNSPVDDLIAQNMTILINISASPFEQNKHTRRIHNLSQHAIKAKTPAVWVNNIGANDNLIFDGNSFVVNSKGILSLQMKSFQEDITTLETNTLALSPLFKSSTSQNTLEDINQALVLGIKDYMHKCGITKAVLGISGGIDSALTAVLACSALKPSNVLGIFMPSPYSSRESLEDAQKLTKLLKMELKTIPITPILSKFQNIFDEHFPNTQKDSTEENIQARIRANILMAFANKENRFLLTTGNKSEIAIGYCTLYGDMSGALSVIGDLTKTTVYQLSQHINKTKKRIPSSILSKDPSAELRPNQKDSDSLPDYATLDFVLESYIEKGFSIEEIVSQGIDYSCVEWIIKKVNQNEHKRNQMPPTLKVTSTSFGQGRRFPIAAIYHSSKIMENTL